MRHLKTVLINDFDLGSDLEGWTLTFARAISSDGLVIVGEGTNPDGFSNVLQLRIEVEDGDGGLLNLARC